MKNFLRALVIFGPTILLIAVLLIATKTRNLTFENKIYRVSYKNSFCYEIDGSQKNSVPGISLISEDGQPILVLNPDDPFFDFFRIPPELMK